LGQVPYFGGDGLSSPQYVPLAGAAADGTYFTAVAPDAGHFAPARAFFTAYRARYGVAAGNYGPASFAAAQVAIAAIAAVLAVHPDRMPTRDEVLARIAATSKLTTAVGPVTFDPTGDLRHATISLYEIRTGRFEFVQQSSAP
jgi:branched-chain amino acid transport system substrate-binding protein